MTWCGKWLYTGYIYILIGIRMWFHPGNMEVYKQLTEDVEGRDHLCQTIIWDMLENFADYENAPELLWLAIREANPLPLKDLNKLYELSKEKEAYKKLYDFYTDLHRGHGTAGEHIQQLRELEEKDN